MLCELLPQRAYLRHSHQQRPRRVSCSEDLCCSRGGRRDVAGANLWGNKLPASRTAATFWHAQGCWAGRIFVGSVSERGWKAVDGGKDGQQQTSRQRNGFRKVPVLG